MQYKGVNIFDKKPDVVRMMFKVLFFFAIVANVVILSVSSTTGSTDQCGKNQTYDTCLTTCPPRECGVNIAAVQCLRIEPKDCKGGCRCADGYLKNSDGYCVAEADCPNVGCGGDENAQSGCGNCRKTCSNYNSTEPQVCPLYCNLNGCDCKDGYVLNEILNKCVLPKDCPKCPKHEVYNPCPDPCPRQLCSVDERVIKCAAPPQPGDKECEPGCVCEDGYKRNDTGTGQCIPKEQCPQICPENEVYDTCPLICPGEDCSVDETVILCAPNPQPGSPDCPAPACRCKDGYKRTAEGYCVPKEDCPHQCGKNQTYDTCLTTCPPRECGVNIAAVQCLRIEPKDCKGGCRCADGYLKNSDGYCVAEADCPNVGCGGDENAQSGCGNCRKTCSNYNSTEPQVCPLFCNLNGCDCKEGYVLNEILNKCVLPKDCPKCPKHEVYNPCPNPCPRQVCSVDERVIRCAAPPQPGDKECEPGCVCEDGYKRNDTGTGQCIPKEQCPQICPENEVYDICPPICPGEDCSVDETVILCAPNPQPGSPDCPAPACRCKDGYKRTAEGYCVPKEDCPPICHGANEIWVPCPNPYDPNTCESIRNNTKDHVQSTDVKQCKGECRCKQGYYRNLNGECNTEEECLRCTGPHEYYACGGACDNVCSTLSQQNQTNCPIINVKCNEMCYCEKGYARDSRKICVPISSCRSCTGKNEWYDTCPFGGCPVNDNCDNKGQAHECPQNHHSSRPPKCGKPICRCEDYHLRLNGTCVPQEQCPCNGDPKAQPGCGCSRSCSDYLANKPPTCTKDCKQDACDCKEGYVLDEKTGKCILPEDCPIPKCPKNEIFDLCPEPCPPETCPDGRVYKCAPPPKPGSSDCEPRCRCKDGYYRDQGKCIPKDQCPIGCKGDLNAVKGCGNCPTTCSNYKIKDQISCIQVCYEDACDCKEGYILDEILKKCVRVEDCSHQ